MKSDYVCMNNKTFEIEKIKNIIPVDEKLSKTISILNKKGYYIDLFYRAKISEPFYIGTIIHELNEEGLVVINNETKEKIKNVIKECNRECTIILFKEKYNFDSLPKGFTLIGNSLQYNLSILKDISDIELKTLLELDKENNESIKDLEKWAKKLPNVK